LVPAAAKAQVKHPGLTATDRFRFCAARTFGKPVLTDLERDDIFGQMCHERDTPENLKKSLASKGISVFEESQFVYLSFSVFFTQTYGSQHRQISISWSPTNGRAQFPRCRPLSEQELVDIGQAVLHDARMTNFPLPYAAADATIRARLLLETYRCQLRAGTDSVFGVLGGTRLIYGEMREHGFALLWDSPEFGLLHNAAYIDQLRDMNGDGVREILVTYDASGAAQAYQGLAIFDTSGNELDPRDDRFVGESFQYETKPDGKVDVLVVNNDHTDRYTLANGRYVLETAPKRSLRKTPRRPSGH
jgi:hypothetical protein